jgi:16S rRNA C1402 N4-methylase RsmH
MTYKHHIPILVHEILEFIQPIYTYIMDGTLGHAGHTIAMIREMQQNANKHITLDGYDLDPRVFVHAQEYLHEAFDEE